MAKLENKLSEYEAKKKKIQMKINQIQRDPIVEYVEFIKMVVCDFFGIEKEDLTKSRGHFSLIPRLYAIALINHHTFLKSDVMYLFKRDRTSWYDSQEEFESLMIDRVNINSFENLKVLTKESEFDNYKMRKYLINSKELTHTWETFKQIENQL